MKTRLKLKPGQKGTKALLDKYGDDLICVRYRYDEKNRTRLKTIELIVDKKELLPSQTEKTKDNGIVPVRITYGQRELGKMARAMGGKWDPDVKLWYIPKRNIEGTELEKHIVLDASMKRVPGKSI